jgi:antitoxin component YwqK of YwqJK toxin-antitoxin module
MLSIGFGSLIENITESYDDGMPKTVKYYKSISNNHLELTMIKEYYENGKISKEENYRNGELNGKWTIFWNGDFYGGIKETGYYKDGKKMENGVGLMKVS